VQRLIEDGVDVNSQNEVCVPEADWVMMSLYFITVQDKKTALHLAAGRGHTGVVRLLIGANADLNLQDKVVYM